MKDVGTQCKEEQPALDIQESVHLVAISHGQGAIEAMMSGKILLLNVDEDGGIVLLLVGKGSREGVSGGIVVMGDMIIEGQ